MTDSAADCIFCKIVGGKIPSPRLHENERFIVIKDIRPQAPTHFLVIPKTHVSSLDDAFVEGKPDQSALVGEMFAVGTQVARKLGLLPAGFRAVINTGVEGGQTVFHIHLHILGGKPFREAL